MNSSKTQPAMPRINEVLGMVQVKVRSPDESVQIHFSIPAGPRVRIHHDKFRQHTETSLAEQLERALAGMLTGSQAGCRSALGKAFGEPPTPEPGSPEARFVMARRRRARELARDVVTEHTSAQRCLRLRLHALNGFTVKLAPGSLRRLGAQAIAEEINSLLRLVLTEHNAKLSAISTTVTREINRSTLEEMISERSS